MKGNQGEYASKILVRKQKEHKKNMQGGQLLKVEAYGKECPLKGFRNLKNYRLQKEAGK